MVYAEVRVRVSLAARSVCIKFVTSAMRITYLFKREASILRNDLSLVLNVGILGQLDLDAYHGVDLPSARAAIARRAAANGDTDDQNDEEDDNDASRDPAVVVVVVPHGLCSEWRRRWRHGRCHETRPRFEASTAAPEVGCSGWGDTAYTAGGGVVADFFVCSFCCLWIVAFSTQRPQRGAFSTHERPQRGVNETLFPRVIMASAGSLSLLIFIYCMCAN